jgi:hypothetical protein
MKKPFAFYILLYNHKNEIPWGEKNKYTRGVIHGGEVI